MAFTRFYHVSLCVSDMERSLGFYRDTLGFRVMAQLVREGPEVSRVMGLANAKFRAAFLKRDGINLELICFDYPKGRAFPREHRSNDIGLSHLTFTVDDLDATIRDLEAKGVTVLHDTRGATRAPICQCKDPDGMIIEMYQAPESQPSLYDG
jgi:glyoxylase I family protein